MGDEGARFPEMLMNSLYTSKQLKLYLRQFGDKEEMLAIGQLKLS